MDSNKIKHKKKNLGQFFTTNADYILQGLEKTISGKSVTDPFAGTRDLMNWAKLHKAKSVIGFDVDKNLVDNKRVFSNDSIRNPRKYDFIITNPPYLHKNKADRKIKDLYFDNINIIFEDLYQVSLNAIIDSNEGIIIVPLNFLSAENSKKIRNIFFEKFEITRLNIFTTQVFSDTTYNVVSFHYKKKKIPKKEVNFSAHVFPDNYTIKVKLQKQYGWQLGGEFIAKINSARNVLGIYRLTLKDLKKGSFSIPLAFNNINSIKEHKVDSVVKNAIKNNIIFLRAIDSKNGKKIQLENIRKYRVYGLVGKETSRNMAYFILKRQLSIKEQKKLIELFNKELAKARDKHFSLFLTNFRDNNRKRIGFDFAYRLLNYIYLKNFDSKEKVINYQQALLSI